MAEIQLKKNWGGYVPGTIKSVSDERAIYLIEEDIARYTPSQVKENELKKTKSEKAAATRLANYEKEYSEIVAKGDKRTDEDVARGTKLEELIKKAKGIE